MFRFASPTWLASSTVQRVSLLAIAGTLVAIGVATAAPLNPNDKIVRSSEKPDPEVLLIGVYKELAANNLRKAQSKADDQVAIICLLPQRSPRAALIF